MQQERYQSRETDLIQILNTQKESFLDSVEDSISSFIKSRSFTECLTIIGRGISDGVEARYSPDPPDSEYVTALIRLYRRQNYNGQRLYWVLSEDIVRIVTDEFEDLYIRNNDVISSSIATSQQSGHSNASASGTSKLAPQEHVNRSVAMVAENISAKTFNMCRRSVNTINSTIAQQVMASSSQCLAANVNAVMAKVTASAAFKTAIAAKIKALVAANAEFIFLKMIAAKFGAIAMGGGAGAVAIVVLPILAGFIIYQAKTFPRKLGDKVSVAVREELSEQFDDINRDMIQMITENALRPSLTLGQTKSSTLKRLGLKIRMLWQYIVARLGVVRGL